MLPCLCAFEPPAEACSCDRAEIVEPGDGATGVPTNTRIVVKSTTYLNPDPGYVLSSASGEVEIAAEIVSENGAYWITEITPVTPLAPSTMYTFIAPWPLEELTFTTGDADDTVAPLAPTVGDLTLAMASYSDEWSSSCGNTFNEVELPIELPEDAVAAEIVVTVAGWTRRAVVLAEDLPYLSNWSDSCGISIALIPEETHYFEIRARDRAGNLSAPIRRETWALECPDIPSPDCIVGHLAGPEGCWDGYAGCMELPPSNEGGGCSTSSPASLGAALALLGLRRRRRRP